MWKYSDAAWQIASRFSDVLASDTRTLAGAIDEVLKQDRQRSAEVVRGHKYALPDIELGKAAQQFNRTLDEIAETIEKGEHG